MLNKMVYTCQSIKANVDKVSKKYGGNKEGDDNIQICQR